MKLLANCLIIGCLIIGCNERSLPKEYLSNIHVVRAMNKATSTPAQKEKKMEQQQEKRLTKEIQTPQETKNAGIRFHIIVASFKEGEKTNAEKTVNRLKAENNPASLVYSSQRFRVSIASFPSEAEAIAALEKYRIITKRQDIWILKAK